MAPAPPRTFNFADIWEFASDAVPEREALVCGPRRLTYGQLEAHANRLAQHFLSVGIEPGEFVGIFCSNATEYLETMYAAYKVRAVPININHRYSTAELAELVDDSGAVALVYEASLAPQVAALGTDRLERFKTMLAVADPSTGAPVTDPGVPGAQAFDDATAAQPTDRPVVAGRSGDDPYVLYTGGTTGRPKGVVWRQEDALYPCFGAGDPTRLNPVSSPEELAERIADFAVTYYCRAAADARGRPVGGHLVAVERGPRHPAHRLVRARARVGHRRRRGGQPAHRRRRRGGQAAARRGGSRSPGAGTCRRASSPSRTAARRCRRASRSAWPRRSRARSSPTGSARRRPAPRAPSGWSRATRRRRPSTAVHRRPADDARGARRRPASRSSPGRASSAASALRGRIPLGYHNDPEKTAATFVERRRRRAGSSPATWPPSTPTARSPCSAAARSASTPAARRSSPRRSRRRCRATPRWPTCWWSACPTSGGASAVSAVVQPRRGTARRRSTSCATTARRDLAGYKLPKHLVLVDQVRALARRQGRLPLGRVGRCRRGRRPRLTSTSPRLLPFRGRICGDGPHIRPQKSGLERTAGERQETSV